MFGEADLRSWVRWWRNYSLAVRPESFLEASALCCRKPFLHPLFDRQPQPIALGSGELLMRSLVCAAVFAIGVILPLADARGDDPPADRPLLKGSVTIYRDTWGVPHIYAKTPGEGAYGLGYAQAQDRLDDIYITCGRAWAAWRRRSAGRSGRAGLHHAALPERGAGQGILGRRPLRTSRNLQRLRRGDPAVCRRASRKGAEVRPQDRAVARAARSAGR